MATLALTAALVLPFTPHTVTELETWQADWSSRAVDALNVEMMDEWRDIRSRHKWFFNPEPEVRVANRLVIAPPPNTNSAPISTSLVLGVEQWRSMVAHYWPAEHVDRMLRIMDCESSGVPTARHPRSGAAGLFQVMPFWQKTWPGDYTDPWTNASVAYQIWLSQGFGAWVCKG